MTEALRQELKQAYDAFERAETAGDETAAAEITAYAENLEQQIMAGPTEPQKIGFAKRFGERFEKRRQMLMHVADVTEAGEQSFGEGLLQGAGKYGAGAVLDFIGEGLISAGRGLSAITPDVIEDPLKAGATKVAYELLNTETGQAGIEALKKGAGAWSKYKEENPRAARNIESVVNIGMLVTPAKGRAAPAKETVAGKVASTLERKAGRQVQQRRKRFLEELVRPKQTAKVRQDQVARTDVVGSFNQKVLKPSKEELRIVAEVGKVPGVTHKKTLQGNWNAVRTEIGKEADRLERRLTASGVTFSRQEIDHVLDMAAQRLQRTDTLVGDAQTVALNLARRAKQIAAKHPATPRGVLQARRDLDQHILKLKGRRGFDPNIENAQTIAIGEVRRAMNDLVQAKAPGVAVKKSLQKQSLLYRALDNIAPKAADEAANALLRLWRRGLALLPLRGEFNQIMAAIFGVGGLGASAIFAPVFTKLALGTAASLVGYKMMTGVTAKKTVSAILKRFDQTIRATKDKNVIRQLRADRALFLEIVKAAEKEDLQNAR